MGTEGEVTVERRMGMHGHVGENALLAIHSFLNALLCLLGAQFVTEILVLCKVVCDNGKCHELTCLIPQETRLRTHS